MFLAVPLIPERKRKWMFGRLQRASAREVIKEVENNRWEGDQ